MSALTLVGDQCGNDTEVSRLPNLCSSGTICSPRRLTGMARFFFEIVNGHRLPDPTGVDCVDEDEAVEHGKAIAARIAEDVPGNKLKRHVTVVDDSGRKVASVAVGDEDVPAIETS
jgi:hypothetical protein